MVYQLKYHQGFQDDLQALPFNEQARILAFLTERFVPALSADPMHTELPRAWDFKRLRGAGTTMIDLYQLRCTPAFRAYVLLAHQNNQLWVVGLVRKGGGKAGDSAQKRAISRALSRARNIREGT